MNVYFELGAPDGLRSRFLADAAEFERWLLDLAGEFSGGYSPEVLAKLADISERGAEALQASDPAEAILIDRVMHDYWNFCSMTGLHGDKDITPAANQWYRFPAELPQLLPSAADDVCGYYRRLFAGNSLAECSGHAYRPVDGIFRWSWLLSHEVSDFCDKLENDSHLLDHETDGAAEVFSILNALRLAKERDCSLLVSVA